MSGGSSGRWTGSWWRGPISLACASEPECPAAREDAVDLVETSFGILSPVYQAVEQGGACFLVEPVAISGDQLHPYAVSDLISAA